METLRKKNERRKNQINTQQRKTGKGKRTEYQD
jgi:hypothetical protein